MDNGKIIQGLDMNRKRIIEGISMIENQIEKGYIDIGWFDDAELDIVSLAIKEFKTNHGLNDV